MTRPPLVSLAIAICAVTVSIAAEERALATNAPAGSAVSPTRPMRAVSSQKARQLATIPLSFDATLSSKPAEASSDLRDTDKPRNTIIRLPSYLVQEDEPARIREREVLTPRSRLSLAYKKYPGLRVGSIGPYRNDSVALVMLADDERRERLREIQDLVSLLPAFEQKQVRPAIQDAFARFDLPR